MAKESGSAKRPLLCSFDINSVSSSRASRQGFYQGCWKEPACPVLPRPGAHLGGADPLLSCTPAPCCLSMSALHCPGPWGPAPRCQQHPSYLPTPWKHAHFASSSRPRCYSLWWWCPDSGGGGAGRAWAPLSASVLVQSPWPPPFRPHVA